MIGVLADGLIDRSMGMKVSALGLNIFGLNKLGNVHGDEKNGQTATTVSNPAFKEVPRQFNKGLLVVLDGFGLKEGGKKNPFSKATMPFYKSLINNAYGDTLFRPIHASGAYVGLPQNLAGSSEVGHNNLGAGRMVPQDLMVINEAINDRTFSINKAILGAIQHVKERGSTLHLMTLLSDGYVHSATNHLHEIIRLAAHHNVEDVRVHAFLDGRDVPEGSAPEYVKKTNDVLKQYGYDEIKSFIGMKYPMDRSRKWSHTQRAYELLVDGISDYQAKSFDEIYNKLHFASSKDSIGFLEKDMPPITLEGFKPIKDGDGIIFTNYRNDRTRQLTDAVTQKECTAPFLEGKERLKDINFVCMTEYDPSYHLPVAFPAEVYSNTLTQILNDQNFRPWVAAETEKQAHMTFFFDGKRHIRYSDTSYFFPSSDHSELTPEMEGGTLRDLILSWIKTPKSKAMMVNFANPDMLGHEAKFSKGVKTLNFIDKVLFRLVDTARENKIPTIITADHGNIEDLTHGGHTNNPVPFIAVLPGYEKFIKQGKVFLDKAKDAAISRVAPSFIDILKGAKKPDVMYDSLFKMHEG